MTRAQFEQARHGQEFHHNAQRNADGTCRRWRKNGAVKTWKTRPQEFRVPVKHGLKTCDYITEREADQFHLPGECETVRQSQEKTGWLSEAA